MPLNRPKLHNSESRVCWIFCKKPPANGIGDDCLLSWILTCPRVEKDCPIVWNRPYHIYIGFLWAPKWGYDQYIGQIGKQVGWIFCKTAPAKGIGDDCRFVQLVQDRATAIIAFAPFCFLPLLCCFDGWFNRGRENMSKTLPAPNPPPLLGCQYPLVYCGISTGAPVCGYGMLITITSTEPLA